MWALRSYVLARKGVLVSSPDVKNMTRAQWLLEYHSLQAKEELYMKSMRSLLVNVLGLNAIRPEDANNKPKDWDDMTEEERESFLPLVAWVGRPELLKIAKDQITEGLDQDKIVGDDQYEKLVAAIDDAGGDMDPILGLDKLDIPENPRHIQQANALGLKDRSELDIDPGDV